MNPCQFPTYGPPYSRHQEYCQSIMQTCSLRKNITPKSDGTGTSSDINYLSRSIGTRLVKYSTVYIVFSINLFYLNPAFCKFIRDALPVYLMKCTHDSGVHFLWLNKQFLIYEIFTTLSRVMACCLAAPSHNLSQLPEPKICTWFCCCCFVVVNK